MGRADQDDKVAEFSEIHAKAGINENSKEEKEEKEEEEN